MTNTNYVAKTFKKGDATEVAATARQAVALRFRGYKQVVDTAIKSDVQEPTYAELVAQAKDLQTKGHDLKASGSYDDLFDAVVAAQADQNELDAAEVEA